MTVDLALFTKLALIIMMLGMGLSLVIDDFKRALGSPRVIVIGLINQLVMLPVIAFALLLITPLKPAIAIGIMIIAACPGGVTSNLITHVSKGDTALSISLTTLSSLLTLLTIPFIVNFALQYFTPEGQRIVQLDPIKTVATLMAVIIVPVAIGMLVRRFFLQLANALALPVKVLSVVVIILVIIGVLMQHREGLGGYFEQAGVAALLLNVIVMTLSYFSVCFLMGSNRYAKTVAIESGIQNSALALTIATGLLGNTAYAIAPIVYTLIMFATVGVFVAILNRRFGTESPA